MSADQIISLENATISHPNNVVLTKIDLKINKGEFIYVIGRTGTGKSTTTVSR